MKHMFNNINIQICKAQIKNATSTTRIQVTPGAMNTLDHQISYGVKLL